MSGAYFPQNIPKKSGKDYGWKNEFCFWKLSIRQNQRHSIKNNKNIFIEFNVDFVEMSP